MKKIAGIFIMTLPFDFLFVYIAYEDGLEMAARTFGLSLAFIGLITIAVLIGMKLIDD